MRSIFSKTLLLTSFFSTLFGCNKSDTVKSNLPEIINVKEEGFNDIALKIVETENSANAFLYTVKGKYKNKIVGLKLTVQNNINAGIVNGKLDSNAFYRKGMTLQSIGEESDNFLHALCKIYGIKCNDKFSIKPITVTIFPLNEIEANLSNPNYYRFKAFFNDDEENDYAEIFINLNLEENLVEFNEKDNEYRANIIKTYSRK
ncbi:hypothetical protein DRF60_06340 [Chryseobacterium elymi]|uniref:Lipoprotein n=1 Tax=Chryseobacterium elymi TaxID=395936 RepID=A0A3D9DN44_9FLAO|nr:hypothetical protein [Chryseobacterium elymi]REC79438.1 hypothetical protein DRF60_06340 [Chryseobacterium elymi]